MMIRQIRKPASVPVIFSIRRRDAFLIEPNRLDFRLEEDQFLTTTPDLTWRGREGESNA